MFSWWRGSLLLPKANFKLRLKLSLNLIHMLLLVPSISIPFIFNNTIIPSNHPRHQLYQIMPLCNWLLAHSFMQKKEQRAISNTKTDCHQLITISYLEALCLWLIVVILSFLDYLLLLQCATQYNQLFLKFVVSLSDLDHLAWHYAKKREELE